MVDPDSRYAHMNLPQARTIVGRVGRSLEAAFEQGGSGGNLELHALEAALSGYNEDPPLPGALRTADPAAESGRLPVTLILKTTLRADPLGQRVRHRFECLGLAAEGARLSLACGEPDSPVP